MTTYREELTAAIRGNARLRRRLEAKERRIKELEQAVRLMVMWDVGVARKFREAMG